MKRFLSLIRYLISVHLCGMLFFSIFRIVLFFVNKGQAAGVENGLLLFTKSMLKGLQTDNLMACYVSCLPALFLSLFTLFRNIPKAAIIACNIYYGIFFSLLFIISIADIPYFSYFLAHIGVSAFGWFEFGAETTGLLFQDSANYPYFALMIVSIVLFVILLRLIGKKLYLSQKENIETPNFKLVIPILVLLYAVLFIGMRGSLKRPFRMWDAYFSNSHFYNQLAINPSFYLFKKIEEYRKPTINAVNNLLTKEEAFTFCQQELGIDSINEHLSIARKVNGNQAKTIQKNVVIILLESMSAEYLKYEHEGKTSTPYLHELISKSYFFENFYSAAVHTNNGIVATLYGFPPLLSQRSINSEVTLYEGLPFVLRKQGYHTLFFMGGNSNYDYMNSFLSANGFDRIYDESDYPKEKVVNRFGIQDDYLLNFGLNRLNETAASGNPFFATFLTVSNHSPFIVPEGFQNKGKTDDQRILSFVDHVLKTFMEEAAKQAWYENTIFVVLGDHGRILTPSTYNMPLDNNQVPLIIFSPSFNDMPKRFSQFGGQVDVFPTVMGLLGTSYTNRSMGIDLLQDKNRSCMYFENDNQLGCINENFLYVRDLIVNKDFLYDLKSKTAVSQDNKEVKMLKQYAVSMMTVAEHLIKNGGTREDKD